MRREIFHREMNQRYVTAEPAEPEIIYRAKKNLLSRRRAISQRLLAMKMLGIPYPKLEGFHLFENLLDQPITGKVKSIMDTSERIIKRNYFKPIAYDDKAVWGVRLKGKTDWRANEVLRAKAWLAFVHSRHRE